MEQEDPYVLGIEAAHKGKTIAHCPFQYGTKEADEWIEGFETVKSAD